MGPKKENSKKVAGNAKKAAAANAKAEVENQKKAAVEDEEWKKGSKSNAKKEEAEARKREAAAKKAAREAELAAEESSIKTVKVNPKAGKNNPAAKPKPKVGGLDAALGAFESDSKGPSTISASGIDDALDALSLAHGHKVEVDRHPERRYKAAYAAYEEKRLPELKIEQRGLRQNQMKELIRKEFEKHPDNPFNQAGIVAYNANRDEVSEIRKAEMERLEKRLGR